MYQKREKFIFLLYIAGFLILAGTMAFFQPLANTPPVFANPPDEHARFQIPWYICQYGVIPTGLEEEVRIPAYGFSYGIYNVFPYIVQGYVMRFVGQFAGSIYQVLYAGRLVNVVSGALMAWVVYLTGRKLFVREGIRWLFCFAVMYLPENLFMHTYINTDSFCLLGTAMMVYAWVGAYREGFTRGNNLWLCGGIILVALSYYNAYGFILSSILLFLAYFLGKKDGHLTYDWKAMLKKGVLISAIVLLGIGWWFIRSYILYDGDFLGLATREKLAIQYAIPEVNPLTMSTYEKRGYTVLEMMRENHFLSGAFNSFVAAFGSMSIYGNPWMYRAFKVFFAVSLVGCMVIRKRDGGFLNEKTLCRERKAQGEDSQNRQTFTDPQIRRFRTLFFHMNMILCMLIPLALMIYYAYTMDYQNQGRYLLPAVVPLMYYVVRGIDKLTSLKWVPAWLSNTAVGISIALFVGSSAYMVWIVALPLFLQTGVVM